MNPYEANFSNIVARLMAWIRGLTRRYRKSLFVTLAAAGTLVLGVSAGLAPAKTPAVTELASR